MTKRLLATVLTLAMILSMIVVPANAVETEAPVQTGYCQHCKKVIPEDQWIVWDPANTGPRTGHYYLAEDIVTQPKQITINLDDDLLRNVICLDLRGCTYTVIGLRPFLIYGIFSIMDSVGGGEMAVTGASNAHGGFAMMAKSDKAKDGAGQLNVYSGTIRRINDDRYLVSYGGLLHISGGAALNLYGGKLIGGKVVPHLVGSTNYGAFGGTIYATGAYVNVYGGTLTGGVAQSGTLPKPGSTTETQTFDAYGGNIYAIEGSQVRVSGGVIENGFSDTYAGNISVRDSDITVTGGTIRGGYSGGASGNIEVVVTKSGRDASFTMSGGVIRDGVCAATGGNLRINNGTVDVDISGGEIYGDIYVNYFRTFKLSGAPKIYMGLGNGLQLHQNSGKLDVSGLTKGAEIYLDGTDQVFTDVLEDPQTYLSYFKDAIRADISVDASGALKVTQGNTGFCPHCWKTGKQATWTPFAAYSTDTPINAAGTVFPLDANGQHHAYLTGTTTRTRLLSIQADADLVLDTAGYTLTLQNYKVANLWGKLSLVDSAGNGHVTGTGHSGANGGLIMGVKGSEFNMYSGTLSRTVKSGDTRNVYDGGILYSPEATVNIYGGTVKNGVVTFAHTIAPVPACGGNIFSTGTFNMTAGALLSGTAKSSNGYVNGSTITNSGTIYAGSGGNVYIGGTGTISGGHIVGGAAALGGNIYCTTGDLDITGGVIRDGVTNDDVNGNDYGGNIYYTAIAGGSIENALVRGGKTSTHGGNIYLAGSTLAVKDSLVAEGDAGMGTNGRRGGNAYVAGGSKLQIFGATIANGTATESGGNIFGAVVEMESGLVTGGTAKSGYGGNIYCNGISMTGGRLVGGTATTAQGGNLYVYYAASTTNNYMTIEDDNDDTNPAPVIAKGTSGNLGGNILVDVNITATLSNVHIYGGNGDSRSYHSDVDGDNVYTKEGSKLTMTDTKITDIVSEAAYGNGVYAGGELVLKGSTAITNEAQKSCVYIGSTGKLTVDAGYSGTAYVAFADSHFETPDKPMGEALAQQNTASGVFNGKIFLEGGNGRDYGLPGIIAQSGDNKLYVATTAVINGSTDEISWFKDATAATKELVDKNEYIRLYAANNTVEISGDLRVDVNGKNLTVSGTGTVYGFDSANDDYDGYGHLSATGVDVEPAYLAPNGRQYVAVDGENGTSFHRMGLKVTAVSVRPSISGIYYNCAWECDSILEDKIKTYGVAVSLNDMPGVDFASDNGTMYTVFDEKEFVSGQAKTSVMIANILKEREKLEDGESNTDRGKATIYAAPYVVINDGTASGLALIGADNDPANGGVEYCLQDVMQKVDLIWPKLSEKQKTGVKTLYNIDPQALANWELYNIAAAVNGTASVRPLKVLTIGHSLAVDSGHMLNLIADAEGYNQEMVIGTLYFSGCPLSRHVKHLTENTAAYQLYLSSTATPNTPPVVYDGFTMKKGIEYMDWDIIVMQGGVFEIGHDATYTDGNIQIIQNYVNAHKTNKDAVFAWHMPWAAPTEKSLRDLYTYSPNVYYTDYAAFNDDRATFYNAITGCVEKNIVSDSSFIYLIPSGTAIENALSSYLVETELHRDYIHVSDLGRVISSYTWYCTLAGIEQLDEISLNTIPVAYFKSTTGTQNRVLTQAEKDIILESVNNALANPLKMTQSQYTVAPTAQ